MKTTWSTASSAAINVRSQPAFAIGRACSIAGLTLALAMPAAATSFTVVNLVTDDQSVNAAQITDPNLKNAWGISYGPTSPFWVSSNEVGLSVLYSVDPLTNATSKAPLEVTIPGAGNVTGQVFNPGIATGNFNGDAFLFRQRGRNDLRMARRPGHHRRGARAGIGRTATKGRPSH